MQLLLFPDSRPLEARLGLEFFRQAPECPGVYLMRDQAGTVLYIGKAKNLRKRLGHYRLANPDRMPRRHLRLLRAVVRIDLEECPNEASALARESALLRSLRPRFNRAGTWSGPPRFLGWRVTSEGVDLAAGQEIESGWHSHGPLGSTVTGLRAVLVRLLWCAIHPERALAGMPEGWFRGRFGPVVSIPRLETPVSILDDLEAHLNDLFAGQADHFITWINGRTSMQTHQFELAVLEADLEAVSEFANRRNNRLPPVAVFRENAAKIAIENQEAEVRSAGAR